MEENDERHYSVVRYYTSRAGEGLLTDTLAENLTRSEADEIVRANPPESYDEEVVVVDQELPRPEREVSVTTLRD